MKSYEYIYEGAAQFKVLKRWMDNGKEKVTEYLVSFKKKEWYCSCKGFKFSKDKIVNPCRHIKDIVAQMKQKDPWLLKNRSTFDWARDWLGNTDLSRRFG